MLINFWPLKGAKVSSPGVEEGGGGKHGRTWKRRI